MILVNQSKKKKTIKVGHRFLTVDPESATSDLILGVEDLRSILIANPVNELKIKVTNPSLEMQILSELGADPDYILKD